jgi:hypothetical protein
MKLLSRPVLPLPCEERVGLIGFKLRGQFPSSGLLRKPTSPRREQVNGLRRLRLALLLVLVALSCSSSLWAAVQPDEMLPNPVLEARARALSQQLRCMGFARTSQSMNQTPHWRAANIAKLPESNESLKEDLGTLRDAVELLRTGEPGEMDAPSPSQWPRNYPLAP